MSEIYYISSNGEKIYLDRYPYWMQTGDFLNYTWPYTILNDRILRFKKKPKENGFKITVFGNSLSNYNANCNEIHEIFDKDIRNMSPGRLYFGEYYLVCYVFSSEKTEWEYDCNRHDNQFYIVTDKPDWIKESTKQFFPQSSLEVSDGLDYDFDYEFDYAPEQAGVERWYIDHYASSDFNMIIYGPCVDPKILINGYPHQIYTDLEESDYLIIDSRKHEITKHMANGTTANLYNSRSFEHSVFEKIPCGDVVFNWPGNFGFDVTLFLERSEPEFGSGSTYIETETGKYMITE